MLHRIIQSSQPIFSLLLYIIVAPILWFVYQHPPGEGQLLLSVTALLGLIGTSFFMGVIFEKATLIKNSANASAFALFMVLLMADIKFENLREILFMFVSMLSILQSIRIYQEDKPGAHYLILGIMTSVQFLLLPFVGVYSIAGILPFMMFGAGIKIKGLVSYLMGVVISIYLYFSAGYLFGLDLDISFEINLKVYNIFSDIMAWVGPFVLIGAAVLIGLPSGMSLFKDLSVERRFYHRLVLFHCTLVLAQGVILSITNRTSAVDIIAAFSTVMLFTILFAKVRRTWVSGIFLFLALAIFIGRSYFI